MDFKEWAKRHSFSNTHRPPCPGLAWGQKLASQDLCSPEDRLCWNMKASCDFLSDEPPPVQGLFVFFRWNIRCFCTAASHRELHKYELQKSKQTKPNLMHHLNRAYFRHCCDFWFTPEKDMFLRKQIYKTSKLGSVFLVDSLQTISLIPCNNVVKIVLNSQKCYFFGSII